MLKTNNYFIMQRNNNSEGLIVYNNYKNLNNDL